MPKKQKDKNLVISLSVPRFKIAVQEAADINKELVKGLRERIGQNFISREDHNLIGGLNLKMKGIPFLQFEIGNMNLRVLQHQSQTAICFYI